MKLNEDDLYRTSSQYKHWSFTSAKLAQLRQKTNIQASERVKANVARQRAQRAKNLDTASASESERANTPGFENGNGGSTPMPLDKEVDCLTAAEEMKLVDKFCEAALDLGNFIKAPTDVTATAVQFLRRFYLYNSPMTYHGQNISRSAMYLACKTEGWHIPCDDYASKFPKVTREQVLAPEYLIVQALRFNFDVRHPFRGLRGAHLELGEMKSGTYDPLPHDQRSSAQIQAEMLRLPKRTDGAPTNLTEDECRKRLEYDYMFASNILKTTAQLTDAYFLYTPSQIWLAAHFLADEPLTTFYLDAKIPPSSPIREKLLATIRACAALLASHRSYSSSSTSKEEKDARAKREEAEIAVLVKKLKHCRDPDKIDLVKLNRAQKRDAVQDGALEESKAKRRKLDRERAQKEADEFWGPELPKNGTKPG